MDINEPGFTLGSFVSSFSTLLSFGENASYLPNIIGKHIIYNQLIVYICDVVIKRIA